LRVGCATKKKKIRILEMVGEEKRTPSASVRVVNGRIDVSQVNFAHETVDLYIYIVVKVELDAILRED